MKPLAKKDIMKASGAVTLIVLALAAIFQMYMSQQIHPVKFANLPPGFSEKEHSMKGPGNGASDDIDPSKLK